MAEIRKTDTILDRIVDHKIEEVEKLKASASRPPLPETSNHPRRDFLAALRDPKRTGRPIIAEIKRASPSAGTLREPFDAAQMARTYQQSDARCISVITDEEFFQGSIALLGEVRAAVTLPVLRKDFIIDRVQIEEALRAGADAVLLIARILSDRLLTDLYQAALEARLTPLIEAHDEDDLEKALALKPRPELIGINNRDLRDFSVSVDRTLRLLPLVPEGVTVISESGLAEPRVLERLGAEGVHGFLIGTALIQAPDPGLLLRRLVHE